MGDERELDMAAEREASLERREQQRAANALRTRAHVCRRALVERSMDGRRDIPRTLQEAAERLWPTIEPGERAEIVAAAENLHTEARHVTATLTTAQITDIARSYLRANNDATARELYAHVEKQGTPSLTFGSFQVMVATPVRKELGISRGVGSGRKKAGGASKRPARTIPPKPVAPVEPESEPEPVAMTPPSISEPEEVEPSGFGDGDRILIQKGQDRMDAQRENGQWHVELNATVDDSMIGRMLATVIGGRP